MAAVRKGSTEMVSLLLEEGAKAELINTVSSAVPAHAPACHGSQHALWWCSIWGTGLDGAGSTVGA